MASETPARRRHPEWWVTALVLFPFGWLIWASFLFAGLRARVARWKLYAGLYLAACFLPVVVSAIANDPSDDSPAGFAIIAVWVVGVVHAFVIRPELIRRTQSGLARAEQAAESRVHTRDEALALAARQPEVAREMGIGRPDVPGAAHAGVIDVNHVPEAVLERLPGIDAPTAQKIVTTRETVGRFSSLADFGMVMDLDGETVEDLRHRCVFLPD